MPSHSYKYLGNNIDGWDSDKNVEPAMAAIIECSL